MLIWIKQTLICFNLQRDGTGNGFSNNKVTFFRKIAATDVSSAPKYVMLQGWSLKLIDGWAEYKEKVPDMSDSSQRKILLQIMGFYFDW